MDSLINTPKDVALLKQADIIEHVLGSDEDVALLFNKLCKGITWDFKNSYPGEVYKEVILHTQKRWPKWRAKLMPDYFSNPWAILSLIAAVVMLNLTFLQTDFAGLESWFFHIRTELNVPKSATPFVIWPKRTCSRFLFKKISNGYQAL